MPDVLLAIRRLLDAARHARPEDVPALAQRLATDLGATRIGVYLIDYSQTELVPFLGRPAEPLSVEPLSVEPLPGEPLSGEPLSVDGTLAGRAFTAVETMDSDHGLWLPLIHGTERLGVLEVVTSDASARADIELAARVFAGVIAARAHYGDAIEQTRRRLPMQLAAEIVWNQLPPLTFATTDVAVNAVLEPCYDVGGDAFDYAVNGDILHVAMFDSVGHGINASALTALVLNAYRNARRCGLDLSDTYRSMDKWVHDQYPDKFVTAILAELHMPTGTYRKIAAGHPGELLLREGKLVKELPTPTAVPLGLGHLDDPIPTIVEESLQPGDRILIYTDGVTEARTDKGEYFGLDRLRDFVTNALTDRLPGAETMRRLVHAILAHQDGHLQDDATAALVEWRPQFNPGSSD